MLLCVQVKYIGQMFVLQLPVAIVLFDIISESDIEEPVEEYVEYTFMHDELLALL